MTDYIKREDAYSACCYETPECYMARKDIKALPSADVVEVVRCKDCKHWDEHSQYGFDSENGVYGNYCMLWAPDDDFYAVETPEDGFCYEGERKDNG